MRLLEQNFVVILAFLQRVFGQLNPAALRNGLLVKTFNALPYGPEPFAYSAGSREIGLDVANLTYQCGKVLFEFGKHRNAHVKASQLVERLTSVRQLCAAHDDAATSSLLLKSALSILINVSHHSPPHSGTAWINAAFCGTLTLNGDFWVTSALPLLRP
jgi:hypothetical protein